MIDVVGMVVAGGVVLFGAWVAGLRRKLRKGKRVFPHVRYRGYFSIRTPQSTPPPQELEVVDIEVVPPPEPDDFDTRDTPDPRPRRRL